MEKDGKMVEQYVVWQGIVNAKNDIKHINEFFKEKGWGKLKYIMEWKTLPGFGGEGGRNDTLFLLTATPKELGSFSIQRLAWGPDTPRWLEDYIDNNMEIIPHKTLKKLEEIRMW